jgi:hypothetical protein
MFVHLKIANFEMTPCILIKKSTNVSDKKVVTIFRIGEIYIRSSCMLDVKGNRLLRTLVSVI